MVGKRRRSARLSAQEREQQLTIDFRAAYQDHAGQFDAIREDERVKQHEAWGPNLEQLYATTYAYFFERDLSVPESPLVRAIKKREQFAVQCLLAHPDTNVNEILTDGSCALTAAVIQSQRSDSPDDRFVDMILAHPSVNVQAGEPSGVYEAACGGDVDLLQRLIHHSSYRPGYNRSWNWQKSPFLVACRRGNLMAVQAFTALPGFALEKKTQMVSVKLTCEVDKLDMMMLLIGLVPGGWGAFQPAERQSILLTAVRSNSVTVLEHLFQEEHFERDPMDEKLFINAACASGAAKALEFLLTRSQVDLDHPDLLSNAMRNGSILQRLLQEDRLVISPDAICLACEKSYHIHLLLLLNDPRGSVLRFTQNQKGQLPALLLAALSIHSYYHEERNRILEEEFMSHPDFPVNQIDQAGSTLLMQVIQHRNWSIFDKLLAHQDVDLNVVDSHGRCAMLMYARWATEEQYMALLAHPNTLNLNIMQGTDSCLSTALRKQPEWKRVLRYVLEQESLSSRVINQPLYFPEHSVRWANRPLPFDRPMVHPIWALPSLGPDLVSKMLDHPHFQRQETMDVPIGLRDLYIDQREVVGLGDCLLQMLNRGAIDPSNELMEIAYNLRHVELVRTLGNHEILLPRFPDMDFVRRLTAPKSAASSLPWDE